LAARIPVCEDREFMLIEMPGVEIPWKSGTADAAARDVGARQPMLRCGRPPGRGQSASGT
jgi:hypothetical protein